MQFENTKKESAGFLIKGVIKGIGSTKVLLGNKPNGYATGFKMKYLQCQLLFSYGKVLITNVQCFLFF